MRALVTGGSGYFGSLLLQKLRALGHECAVLDVRDADDRPADVRFIRADIRDAKAVENAAAGVDVIFHNVAQVPLAKDRELFESVNVTGTENLARAALSQRVSKVIYTSSSAIFGVPKTNPVDEHTPPSPAEAYGRAKLEGEQVCQRYVARGLDVTVIRPRTILGHGRLGIFQILFEWIRQGFNVPVLGRGDNVYQFVHADDLAEACILAGSRSGPAVYNCGAEHFGTMRQGLEQLCARAGTGSKVKSVPMGLAVAGMNITSALGLSPLGPYHSLMYGRSMYFDIGKAKSELGWRPRYSNDEMLFDSYRWYVEHREAIERTQGASHHRSPVRQGILKLARHLW
jgi:nucleoside-diphosphate-sugar epimerase